MSSTPGGGGGGPAVAVEAAVEDNYRSQRRNQEGQPPKRAHLGTTATPPNIPTVSPPVVEHQDLPEPSTELHGQLSLLDYFDTYLPASPSPPVEDSDLHEF